MAKINWDIIQNLRDLLRKLDFAFANVDISNNFKGFIETVTIPAGQELRISNSLSSVPRYRIILRQTGNGIIEDGATAWSNDFVYLANNSGNDITATVAFLA